MVLPSPLRIHLSGTLCGALLLSLPAWAENTIPAPYPAERYQNLWQHSPFTLSSASDSGDTAADPKLVLTGLLQIDSKTYASVMDKETKQRFFVGQDASQKLSLVGVQHADDPSSLVVTLKRNGETLQLRYDESYLKHLQASTPVDPASSPPSPPQETHPTAKRPPLVIRPPIGRAPIPAPAKP